MSTTPIEVALRQHEAEEHAADLAREAPNFCDEYDLRQVVGADLVEPLADLFSTRGMVRMLGRSEAFKDFVNQGKALEWLLRDLDALERALRRRWDAS